MLRFPISLDVFRIEPGRSDFVERVALPEPGIYVIGRGRRSLFRIEDGDVSRTHCILEVRPEAIIVTDRSQAGTSIGATAITRAAWDGAEYLRIPHYEIRMRREAAARLARGFEAPPETKSRLSQAEFTGLFGVASPAEAEVAIRFPGNLFTRDVVAVETIYRSGFFSGECDYIGLGAGLGTFAWVDTLRIHGVPASRIRVIGQDPVPYTNYARYCRYSQIPLHERLRSNSASTPDNIWGFPGYASRETWRDLKRGNLSGLAHVLDVFGEPALRQSYTPTATDVFASIDQEAIRIGWGETFLQGKILGLRKTDDGRYAVAYRVTDGRFQSRRDNIAIAQFLHLAVGYPATRYTEDLQDFLHTFRDDRHLVANAYESHDAIYRNLEQQGQAATVVVRGRGIVASRILQRLREARNWNARISIVHQMRTPLPPDRGERWGRARRWVFNDVEHQPFNWPKACWGGELRRDIEGSSEIARARMFKVLGGTTTAKRRDWIALIRQGTREGWYRKSFGVVTGMRPEGPPDARRLVITISRDGATAETLTANYIIDCTGLIADPEQSPFLTDLIRTYGLRRNKVSGPGGEQRVTGIKVAANFEIEGLRNGKGRVYASGALTQNGPYAPVDSFLGLQYAALRAVDNLADLGAPAVSSLGAFRSLSQWLRWCSGKTPEGRTLRS